jgi:toxin ParE1/3/4
MTLAFSPAAMADIGEIVDYIAKADRRAARRWAESVRAGCRRLSTNPGLGAARDEIRPTLRMFPIGNYLVLYEALEAPVKGGVLIVRILHTARLWSDLV